MKIKDIWTAGSGSKHTFTQICEEIREHSLAGGSIFVGTDSFLTGEKCIFATAICLHGANGQSGGRYFFKRSRKSRKN